MAFDKSVAPYHDDYDENKLFSSILFVPGRAVQVRELNQLQTILQNQVSRSNDHLFKDGSVVIPGEVNFDLEYKYAKLTLNGVYSTYQNALEGVGVFAVGQTSGVLAEVEQFVDVESSDPLTVYLKYTDSGFSGVEKQFTTTEQINFFSWTTTQGTIVEVDSASGIYTLGETVTGGTSLATGDVVSFFKNKLYLTNVSGTFQAGEVLTGGTSSETSNSVTVNTGDLPSNIIDATVDEVGNGSAATVSNGIYYVDGNFVLVLDQTLILDKYTSTPSYRIGFDINYSAVSFQDDGTLLDNASGTPNFTAPGADRLKIQLVLNKRGIGTTDDQDFIEILRLENGDLKMQARGADYNLLRETLASRTYDESGDYVVDNFDISMREHLLENNNGGVYTAGNGGDSEKLVAVLDQGKAYVRGYDVETISTTHVEIDKARDFNSQNNSISNTNFGNYIKISNMNVIPDFGDFDTVDFYSGAVGTDGAVPAGTLQGSARVRFIQYDSGTITTQATAKFKLFLFDIRNTSGDFDSSILATSLSVYHAGANFTADITDSSKLFEGDKNTLLYKLPFSTIKTLKPLGVSDTSYNITKAFDATVASGQILLNAGTDEVFIGYSQDKYLLSIVHDNPSRDATQDVMLDIGALTFTLGGAPTGKSLTISGLGAYDGQTARLVATLAKTSEEKVKTPTVGNLAAGTLVSGVLSLAKADVYEITSIIDDSTSQDITYQFTLDTGRRENYYDVSSISHLPGFPSPATTVTVAFNYFAHGAGDYFSVDSYSSINYEDIPNESIGGEDICLSDLIDFRPRIADDGSGFTGTGAIHGAMPFINDIFRADIEYYLHRIDKLFVDINGEFNVIKGIPSLTPQVPDDPDNAIVLHTLTVPAYTKSTEDVDIESKENRRYTMSDIAKLENRISNLEEYTVLSLLEKDTADMKILDGAGLERFKNGFAVDSFVDHGIGDSNRDDYECSIDAESGHLRPEFYIDGVELSFEATGSSDYQITGDYITLPYTEVELIKQPFATRTINVNPYAVFTWQGSISLTPSSDTWVDVRYTDPIVINRTVRINEDNIDNRRIRARGNWQARRNRRTRTFFTRRWGVWRTNWFGTRRRSGILIDPDTINRDSNTANVFGTNRRISLRRRNLFTTIQSRTVRTSNVSSRVVQDRTIDTSVIPFIRSKTVTFTGTGFKPYSRVYPFFDGVDVSAFCTPTSGPGTGLGGELRTDSKGEITGTFAIPNTQANRFRVGVKEFKLIDDVGNDEGNATTFGNASYTARGVLRTAQRTVLTTRQIINRTVRRRVTVAVTNPVPVVRRRWRDPLAESFLIEPPEGIFATSIDVYFSTIDPDIPVTLELREMVNGYPGQDIIPGGVVTLDPSTITVSANGSDNPTKFTFERPVFLQGGEEYCFVLMANSTKYNVWISRMGEEIVGTQSYVSKQPYIGVMFKSQNNSTWSAAQNDDIKFTINRAQFDTAKTPIVKLKPSQTEALLLDENPLEADGTTSIIVYAPNHNLLASSSVTLSDITPAFGIPDGELNTKHTVTSIISRDKFEITTTTAANSTGFFGGVSVYCDRNYSFSELTMNMQTLVLNDTSLDLVANVTTHKSYDGGETPYNVIATDYPMLNREPLEFNAPMARYNPDEEADNLAGADSLMFTATLASTKDNISPVIDIDGSSVILVGSRVNSPTVPDETLVFGGDADARYITQPIELEIEANSLRVFVDVNRPQGSNVEVFYRTGAVESEILDSTWVSLPSIIESAATDDGQFYENEFGVDSIADYKFYQIKVVMYSTNDAKVPKCSALRIIALGT